MPASFCAATIHECVSCTGFKSNDMIASKWKLSSQGGSIITSEPNDMAQARPILIEAWKLIPCHGDRYPIH